MKKIWGLDIFRGLAAMLVFLFHYWTFYSLPNTEIFLGKIFSAGHLGVDIFFVLSGFLVSLSLFRYCENSDKNTSSVRATQWVAPTRGLKKYFSARFRRIVPLAILTTVLFFIAKQNFSAQNFLDFFAHIFFVQGFFQDFYHGINPVMWTLSVEMLFYILLPVLYIFIAKKNFTKFLTISFFLVLLSFAWRAVVFFYFPESSAQEKIFLSEQLWGRFDQFFLGMVLAVMVFTKKNNVGAVPCVCPNTHNNSTMRICSPFDKLRDRMPNSNYFSMILGIILLTYSFYTFAELGSSFREIFWMQVFLHSIVGFGFFLFLLGFIGLQNKIIIKQGNHDVLNFMKCLVPISSVKGTPLQKKIFFPFLFLGKISYGIYLFHFPILSQISKFFPSSQLLGFFIALMLTLLLSWLSWEFFEKKFLVRKKK